MLPCLQGDAVSVSPSILTSQGQGQGQGHGSRPHSCLFDPNKPLTQLSLSSIFSITANGCTRSPKPGTQYHPRSSTPHTVLPCQSIYFSNPGQAPAALESLSPAPSTRFWEACPDQPPGDADSSQILFYHTMLRLPMVSQTSW